MDRRTVEAIAEAIAHYSGYMEPTNPLYKARNPLGLRPLKPEHPFDEMGNRIFRSVLDGMQAAIFDLEVKLGGRLSPDSTLSDLAVAYGRKPTEAQAWSRFLRAALDDASITAHTQIKRFLEEQ
jgi:hypothetical protein